MGRNIFNTSNANIPSVWDRADGGLTSDMGTAAPTIGSNDNGYGVGINYANPGASLADGGQTIFEEFSDSPTLEFAEQCTITHRFSADRYSAINIQSSYPRGYIMYDNSSGPFGPNVSRVLSTTAKPIAKTNAWVWEVTVTSEAQSFANPPDEFDIDIVELNPSSEKHPRYQAMSYDERNIVRNAFVADYIDVKQAYSNIITSFSSSADQWEDQQGQALELLFKRQKGEDSFYLSGYKLIFSQYFWAPVILNPGGYIENPFTVVPSLYWTDIDDNNIFSETQTHNANLYPNPVTDDGIFGLSWLRQADTLHRQRTWYKLTRTWIGAPIAHWDNEWYNPVLQPLQTDATAGGIILG